MKALSARSKFLETLRTSESPKAYDLLSTSKSKKKKDGNDRTPKEGTSHYPSKKKRQHQRKPLRAAVQICRQPCTARTVVRSVHRHGWSAGSLQVDYIKRWDVTDVNQKEVNK